MLRGTPPRLLDEWQNAPQLWNRVRRECDDRALPGQFILTGSALPQDDITRHTGVGRISRVLMRPMSLARHTSTEAKITTLASDAGGDTPLSRNTVAAYLDALERVFVVEDQPAWSVGLRSRAALRRAPKRHFVDPSLAASLLRASPERLLADPETFGLLFESLVVRDLRIYGQEDRCEVFHYRDDTGLEADAILERDDGAWMAVEVKLSPAPAVVDKAAKSLLRLRNKVSRSRSEELAGLLVVTSTGAAYRRPDGVHVTPITVLGP